MRRPELPDQDLARVVRERVAHLLAEGGARRAAPPDPTGPQASPAPDPPSVSPEPIRLARPPAAAPVERPVVRPDQPAEGGDRADGHHGADGGDRAGSRDRPARRFGRRHLAVVLALLVLGLLVSGWGLLRARPVAVAAGAGVPQAADLTPSTASDPTATPAPAGAAATATPGSASRAEVVVHVIGRVRRPGLARLPAGSRVDDAIRDRGGLQPDADPAQLNLAQVLDDGQQVVVGRRGRPAGEVRGTGSGPANGTSGPRVAVVDLNTATPAELEQLPGVGPVTAAAIVTWREQRGRFSRVEDLQEVDGIGPKTYARLAPYLRV